LLALVARVPGLAERWFGEAAKLGAKVEEYAGPLAEAALAGADEDLRQAEGLLVAGREALAAGKLPEAAKAFSQAEKRYRQAESALAELASKYAQAEWYRTGKVAVEAARQTARRGVVESGAEKLYAQAVQLFQEKEFHDLKPLVDELKAQYGNTAVVTDAGRKPPFAELEKATSGLGPRLTVALSGKADFRSIQAAIDAAHGGELIEILDDGPYNEYLLIPAARTGLTLRGKRGRWPVVTSLVPKPQPDKAVLAVSGTRITLQRLILLKLDPLLGRALLLDNPPKFTADSLLLFAPPGQGCALQGRAQFAPSDTRVQNCLILGFFEGNNVALTFSNCIYPLDCGISLYDPVVFQSCTINTLVRCGEPSLIDCIVRDVIIDPNNPRAKIENCATFGQGRPPQEAKNSFLTNPMFRDPANLDYRLMPGSPCIGKASDGGDIGCRYTPEMIELCKVALELRRRGIINF
jgi:tetratricopeptide (TPR) repeat protein